jgi:hypothetical protein
MNDQLIFKLANYLLLWKKLFNHFFEGFKRCEKIKRITLNRSEKIRGQHLKYGYFLCGLNFSIGILFTQSNSTQLIDQIVSLFTFIFEFLGFSVSQSRATY